jgi:rubrerythrin
MQGVITRVQVLTHPVVVFESFGLKVLLRAIFADAKETFLEIVRRSAEEEAHREMVESDLLRTVKCFIGFESRVGEIYRRLSEQLSDVPAAARFLATLARQEEGHAIVLSRVRREITRGRIWKKSRDVHLGSLDAFEARLAVHEAEVCGGVTLDRALDIVEGIESSELNVTFDTLNGSVDMRSRARFERFFVMTRKHLAYCNEQIRALRARCEPGTARSA